MKVRRLPIGESGLANRRAVATIDGMARENMGYTEGPHRTMTAERREELGYEVLFLRPVEGTKDKLAKLAKKLGVSPSQAIAILLDEALDKRAGR